MVSPPAPTSPARSSGLIGAIAVAALIAGTLDYTAAITKFLIDGGKEPIKIAWYIASSLLGRDTAYAGGYATAAFGILVHYLIATGWTVLFFLAYPRLALLRQNVIAVGVGYGLFVWLMMNRVLVPMTRIKTGPFTFNANAAIQAGILVVCIGLPVALLARRHYAQGRTEPA